MPTFVLKSQLNYGVKNLFADLGHSKDICVSSLCRQRIRTGIDWMMKYAAVSAAWCYCCWFVWQDIGDVVVSDESAELSDGHADLSDALWKL